MSYSVPPGLALFPGGVIESMCAGVSTPTLVSFCALFARSIWPADAPTPTLLVAACADSAAPLSRSKNPTLYPSLPGFYRGTVLVASAASGPSSHTGIDSSDQCGGRRLRHARSAAPTER